MLKNKCSVWKRIKFPTFWYNCYYFTWSDTYFIQLETLLINHPSYKIQYVALKLAVLNKAPCLGDTWRTGGMCDLGVSGRWVVSSWPQSLYSSRVASGPHWWVSLKSRYGAAGSYHSIRGQSLYRLRGLLPVESDFWCLYQPLLADGCAALVQSTDDWERQAGVLG